MFTQSVSPYPKDGIYQTNKSFKFREIPQIEPRSRPRTPTEGSLEAGPWLERDRGTSYLLVVLTTLFFILVISLSFYIGRTWESQFSSSATLLLEDITQYSPLLEDISLTYTLTQFNGSLLKPNLYRGDASPEVDNVWDALGVNYRSIAIPPTLAARSGLKADQVKINPRYGGGYPANIEGLHHLHCLNLLRQSLYYNFDHYKKKGEGAFTNEPHILKLHISHCLDILRQQLMCTVDIGVLGQIWIHPEAPEPYVDFNTKQKCRNFDDIRQWAEERQMPPAENVPNDWLEPPKVGDRIYEEMP